MEDNNVSCVTYIFDGYTWKILQNEDSFLVNEDELIFAKLNGETKSNFHIKIEKKCGWPWKRKTKVFYQEFPFRFFDSIREEDIHKVLFEENERHDLFIKDDGEIYIKSRIRLCFSNGKQVIRYYRTNEDAKIDFDNIKKKYPQLNTLSELVSGFAVNNIK